MADMNEQQLCLLNNRAEELDLRIRRELTALVYASDFAHNQDKHRVLFHIGAMRKELAPVATVRNELVALETMRKRQAEEALRQPKFQHELEQRRLITIVRRWFETIERPQYHPHVLVGNQLGGRFQELLDDEALCMSAPQVQAEVSQPHFEAREEEIARSQSEEAGALRACGEALAERLTVRDEHTTLRRQPAAMPSQAAALTSEIVEKRAACDERALLRQQMQATVDMKNVVLRPFFNGWDMALLGRAHRPENNSLET